MDQSPTNPLSDNSSLATPSTDTDSPRLPQVTEVPISTDTPINSTPIPNTPTPPISIPTPPDTTTSPQSTNNAMSDIAPLILPTTSPTLPSTPTTPVSSSPTPPLVINQTTSTITQTAPITAPTRQTPPLIPPPMSVTPSPPQYIPSHPPSTASALSNPMATPPTLKTQPIDARITVTSSNKSGPGVGTIIGILVLIFILIFGGLFGFGVMIAYGRIKLPSQDIQTQIQQAIFRLPFMPKTPQYILQAMTTAHQDVASAHIEASLATQSNSINSLLGTQDFNMAISGDIDGGDTDNPQFSLKFQLTSEFDADLMVVDKKMYAKINKLPQVITGMVLGLASEGVTLDPLLNQWFWYDTTELKTEASQALQENTPTDTSPEYHRFLDRVFQEVIMPKIIMTPEKLEGDSVYKLAVDLVGSDIDAITDIYQSEVGSTLPKIGTLDTDEIKTSDVVKNIKFTLWILKDDYYLRKSTLVFRVDNSAYVSKLSGPDSVTGPMPLPQQEVVDIALALSLTQVGEPVNLTPPDDAISTEEYVAKITQLMMQIQVPQDQSMTNSSMPPILGIIDEWVDQPQESE